MKFCGLEGKILEAMGGNIWCHWFVLLPEAPGRTQRHARMMWKNRISSYQTRLQQFQMKLKKMACEFVVTCVVWNRHGKEITQGNWLSSIQDTLHHLHVCGLCLPLQWFYRKHRQWLHFLHQELRQLYYFHYIGNFDNIPVVPIIITTTIHNLLMVFDSVGVKVDEQVQAHKIDVSTFSPFQDDFSLPGRSVDHWPMSVP